MTVEGGNSLSGVAGSDESGVVLTEDEAEGQLEVEVEEVVLHSTRPNVNSLSQMLLLL